MPSMRLSSAHGGLPLLLRVGASEMTIGVRIEGGGPALDYSFTAAAEGGRLAVVRENVVPIDGDTAAVGGIRGQSASGEDLWQPANEHSVRWRMLPNRLALTSLSGRDAPELARVRLVQGGEEVLDVGRLAQDLEHLDQRALPAAVVSDQDRQAVEAEAHVGERADPLDAKLRDAIGGHDRDATTPSEEGASKVSHTASFPASPHFSIQPLARRR
jgi:hypothetical protein